MHAPDFKKFHPCVSIGGPLTVLYLRPRIETHGSFVFSQSAFGPQRCKDLWYWVLFVVAWLDEGEGRPNNPSMFEVFEHTADLGLRVRAATQEELFVEAARALFSVLIANPAALQAVDTRVIRVDGTQSDYLLFDWLNELLYLFETERLLFAEFTVQFDESGLTAQCQGENLDPSRHVLEHEVKAITYHGLKVEADDAGWMAELIVDI